jgi:CRISPR-associated endoribonuclease Cas6
VITGWEVELQYEGGKVYPQWGSVLHGALMERFEAGFSQIMHEQNTKPLSQYIIPTATGGRWQIAALNAQASEQVERALQGWDSLHLKQKELTLPMVSQKMIFQSSYEELAKKHYLQPEFQRLIRFNFVTPASFKSEGRYQIFPRVEWIIQNLVMRWDAFSPVLSLADEETMAGIIRHVSIRRYNLRSAVFSLDGVKINGFSGWVELGIQGPENLARIVGLLAAYGNYAGVGIKTTLGMGGMRSESSLMSKV